MDITELILKLWGFVDKILGKTASKIVTCVVVAGGIILFLLWVVPWAIGRIDLLADRFDINIVPKSLTFISFGEYGSILLIVLVALVFISVILLAIAMPILLIVRVGIDASQRGKVEKLLNIIQAVLINAKNNIPQQIPELEDAISEIEQIKKQHKLY